MSEIMAADLPNMSDYFQLAQSGVITAVAWLRLVVEIMGAMVIGIGIVIAAVGFVRIGPDRNGEGFRNVRLTLARYLVLALEFQLAADILSTAISPSWDQIGKLGAIAFIRTALNYFLVREIMMVKREIESEHHQAVEKA